MSPLFVCLKILKFLWNSLYMNIAEYRTAEKMAVQNVNRALTEESYSPCLFSIDEEEIWSIKQNPKKKNKAIHLKFSLVSGAVPTV